MSDFKIASREQENVNVLAFEGLSGCPTLPETRGGIPEPHRKPAFQDRGELQGFSYISSAVLACSWAFIGRTLRQNMGDIKLTNMSPKVYNVFSTCLGFPLLTKYSRRKRSDQPIL